jgi:hypothetical protein
MSKSNFCINNKCVGFFKQPFLWQLSIGTLVIVLMASCNNDQDKANVYNPELPTTLTSFYPNEGRFHERIILDGENLPTDPKLIKVYFNKRISPVIGSTGKRMYVMAPRLPGNADGRPEPEPSKAGNKRDICEISVVVNGDSLVYTDTFMYEEAVTVTTIAGNGALMEFQEGPLASSVFQPYYICMDKEDNIFITSRSSDNTTYNYFCRLNEELNLFERLQSTSLQANVPCADLVTGVITAATESSIGSFITCDPDEYWAPRRREMKWLTAPAHNQYGWKHCMVVNPTLQKDINGNDVNFVYTRWYQGALVRINPSTYEAEVLMETGTCNTYGMTFRPGEPNVLYLAFWSDPHEHQNSICTIDLNVDPPVVTKISSTNTSGGHRDGPLSLAQFRQPAQIFSDDDGFIYIADYGNHCIRRITPENQVETVLGIPGQAGYQDGSRETALFNNPRGIAIGSDGSVYVADYRNARLRKLSVN